MPRSCCSLPLASFLNLAFVNLGRKIKGFFYFVVNSENEKWNERYPTTLSTKSSTNPPLPICSPLLKKATYYVYTLTHPRERPSLCRFLGCTAPVRLSPHITSSHHLRHRRCPQHQLLPRPHLTRIGAYRAGATPPLTVFV